MLSFLKQRPNITSSVCKADTINLPLSPSGSCFCPTLWAVWSRTSRSHSHSLTQVSSAAGSRYYGTASQHLDTVLWDVSQTGCSFLTQAYDLGFFNTLACMNEPGSHRALWHWYKIMPSYIMKRVSVLLNTKAWESLLSWIPRICQLR